jgi:TRAP-type C4-dicarboxylate transport system substrate-binding protein
MMVARKSSLATALLLGLAMSAAPAGAAEFTLRFASVNSPGTSSYDRVLVPFAKAIEEESDGRIEMALKPLGGYGKPTDLFNMVEKGEIEIASTVQGYNPGRFPQSSVMELPLMFENSIAGTEAMMSLYREGLLDKDYASVKVLGLYVLPPYPIFTTGRKIETVRNFRGVRIRSPSVTVGLALSKLGAIPLGIPLTMIGDTLANDIVEAIAYGWDTTATTKGAGGKLLIDQVKVVVDAKLAAPALMVVMNRAKWDALPADLKAIIEKHMSELSVGSATVREETEAVSKKKIQADPRMTALTFSDEQRAELKRVMSPAIEDWKAGMAKRGIDGEKLYTRARQLIDQYKVAGK